MARLISIGQQISCFLNLLAEVGASERGGGRGGDAVAVDFYWSADQLFFKSTGVVG